MNKKIQEKIMRVLLFAAAFTAVFSVLLIGIFVFKEGSPVLLKYGIGQIIFGPKWDPTHQIYGIFPMIIGTIYVTLTAILVGAPMGVAVAIYLAEISSVKLAKVIIPAVEILAGIPSVIYGLFGMSAIRGVIVSLERGVLRDVLPDHYQSGYAIITAAIVLAIMILPTVIKISLDALKAVPSEYKEGSLALGASHWQTIARVLVPAARSGIITAIIWGSAEHWRNDGCDYGNRQHAVDSGIELDGPVCTRQIADGQYCAGNGICRAGTSTSAICCRIVLFVFIICLNSVTSLIVRKGVQN